MVEMQNDVKDIIAKDIKLNMINLASKSKYTDVPYILLQQWKKEDYVVNNVAPMIFTAWVKQFAYDLLSDEIDDSEVMDELVQSPFYRNFLHKFLTGKIKSALCDNRKTNRKRETC
jgi:acyl-homoserine lactone acylase PvdQ